MGRRTRHTYVAYCMYYACRRGGKTAGGMRDGYRWQRMQTDAISQRKDNLNFIFVVVIVHDECRSNQYVFSCSCHIDTLSIPFWLLGCRMWTVPRGINNSKCGTRNLFCDWTEPRRCFWCGRRLSSLVWSQKPPRWSLQSLWRLCMAWRRYGDEDGSWIRCYCFLSGTPSLFDRFEYLFHSLLTLCHSQGLGSAINCNLALVNLDKSDLRYDAGGLHRALHPGAGAITPYYNWTNEVKRKIPVGGELFKVHNL